MAFEAVMLSLILPHLKINPMNPLVFTKLSVMMFLEYFVWGAWYVTMGFYMSGYLDSSATQVGAAYSALAIATMVSPFFVGMIADRYFAAQKIMGWIDRQSTRLN